MKYISLFAGIGGFDLALNRLGHECVYANEWDKYAAQTYEKNFSQKPDTRSIVAVPIEDIPDHDLLVGGFPCQSFSIAGKRRGFLDTRGTLFFEIARILQSKKPHFFIIENVKGLLSHDKGETFRTIISSLDELGYDTQWQVCNSKNFGVPQNRERVFIVGNIRGKTRPKVFPITGEVIKADISSNVAKQGEKKFIKTRFLSQNGSLISNKITLLAGEIAHIVDIKRLYSPEARGQIKNGYVGALHTEGTMAVIGKDSVLRRLTPLEYERLQGFPDGWTGGISDWQRYKCLGNAVTVNVIQAIASRLQA